MDINDIRATVTLISFLVFIGIVLWAWSGKQKQRFEEAANLPFADDPPVSITPSRTGERS
ncbi:MAG: cbb3-type cytochrome c oxidase subunit 3 [Betaproteobacteria bacterium]|nr:cbb3-type cytochrome c oxidase subunit 3 [Betaproteobacteria bacterium]